MTYDPQTVGARLRAEQVPDDERCAGQAWAATHRGVEVAAQLRAARRDDAQVQP